MTHWVIDITKHVPDSSRETLHRAVVHGVSAVSQTYCSQNTQNVSITMKMDSNAWHRRLLVACHTVTHTVIKF